MDGNLPLNERWQTLGTYLDGYMYDPDITVLATRCTEVWPLPLWLTKGHAMNAFVDLY